MIAIAACIIIDLPQVEKVIFVVHKDAETHGIPVLCKSIGNIIPYNNITVVKPGVNSVIRIHVSFKNTTLYNAFS